MEKQFVTYEIALRLKELGFDEECLGHYSINGKLHKLHYGTCGSSKQTEFETLAPLWQQVVDWSRLKYGIHIVIWDYYKEGYYYAINGLTNELEQKIEMDYNDCRNKAIEKAIELIKSK